MRPLTVGDILDGAFRLLRDRFGPVALLILVVLGPLQLASALLTSRVLPGAGTFPAGDPVPGEMVNEEALASVFGLLSVTALLGFVVHVVVGGALVWLVLREDEGQRPTVRQALRAGVSRAWPLVGGTALVGLLALAVGALLVGVGAVLSLVAWPLAVLLAVPAAPLLLGLTVASASLVIPVAMVETDAGAGGSALRALGLVRRRLGRMLGVTALVLLVLTVVTFALSLVLELVGLLTGSLTWVVDGVGGAAISVITTPVTVFAALLLYLDARVRLEGWDLQLRVRRSRTW